MCQLLEDWMVLGDGIRRDLSKVSPEERTRLRDAIIALNKKYYPGGREDQPTGGVSYWFKQDEIHAHTHVHGCPAFLPWHRELVNRFEALIREIDPELSLHYWDWTKHPGDLFTSDFMGNGNGEAGEPWLSAGFYNPNATPFRSDSGTDSNNNPFDPPRTLIRSLTRNAQVTEANDQATISADNWENFSSSLENYHGIAHGSIGGTIQNTHTAFRDPFIFLLHSNADRLFALWQLQPGHPERLNPLTVYGEESNSKGTGTVNWNSETDPNGSDPVWGILSPLEPWAGPEAQNDTTGIVANVRATRPWATPENQQVVKNSCHPTVICPRHYDTNPANLYYVENAYGYTPDGLGFVLHPAGGEMFIVGGEAGLTATLQFELVLPKWNPKAECGPGQPKVVGFWAKDAKFASTNPLTPEGHAISAELCRYQNYKSETEQRITAGPFILRSGPFVISLTSSEGDGCGWPEDTPLTQVRSIKVTYSKS
jgi:hypothetical protein